MTRLQHFAEPYAAEGNIDARAAARAIGRPQLDPWDVFLRETLQNSWDARRAPTGPVSYSVDAFWPDESQISILRQSVFASVLEGSDLAAFLEGHADEQPVLVITDRGTKGLGGPTRADLVTDEATDFVDFVRNVGRAVEKAVGGGTYGFGKGILWSTSSCSTVVIYSKSTYNGESVSRFIAMGHTDSYSDGGHRYTGRHWWGVPHAETSIEPLEGEAADALAESLGMTRLGVEESGTAVMVLGPVGSDTAETLDAIVARLAQAALWWAWPHMVDETIRFEFTYEDAPVEVMDPADHPTLKHFVDAYRRTSEVDQPVDEWPWHQTVLSSARPRLRLGSLVWRNIAMDSLDGAGESLVSIRSNVALMRRPRMVVRYLPVRDDPNGQATVGVFVADGELDREFGSAEPVAHDDWAPANMSLAKGSTNPVKRALEQIKETFVRAAVHVPPGDATNLRQSGVVHLSTQMGDLVSGGGDAGHIDRRPGPPPGPPRALSARVVDRPFLSLINGVPSATFRVAVRVPKNCALPVRVVAEPYVLTESGRDGDATSDGPRLLAWQADASIAKEERRGLLIGETGDHSLAVTVSIPPDSAVALSVSAVEEGSA